MIDAIANAHTPHCSLRSERTYYSPPWEGGVGGVGIQRSHSSDPVAFELSNAVKRFGAESRSSAGQCPPPLPPLPKGGSYEVPPLRRQRSSPTAIQGDVLL